MTTQELLHLAANALEGHDWYLRELIADSEEDVLVEDVIETLRATARHVAGGSRGFIP